MIIAKLIINKISKTISVTQNKAIKFIYNKHNFNAYIYIYI